MVLLFSQSRQWEDHAQMAEGKLRLRSSELKGLRFFSDISRWASVAYINPNGIKNLFNWKPKWIYILDLRHYWWLSHRRNIISASNWNLSFCSKCNRIDFDFYHSERRQLLYSKVSDCSRGWPEGSLFNSYYTEV